MKIGDANSRQGGVGDTGKGKMAGGIEWQTAQLNMAQIVHVEEGHLLCASMEEDNELGKNMKCFIS